MIQLDFYNRTRSRIGARIFEKLLAPSEAALTKEKTIAKKNNFLIELSLVGNSTIRTLNREYHKKDRPTDVISLTFFENKGDDPFIGEIFISLPYARAQAKKIGQSLDEELRFLFVHGVLHVFGYDHMKPDEEAQMLKLTYEILGRK